MRFLPSTLLTFVLFQASQAANPILDYHVVLKPNFGDKSLQGETRLRLHKHTESLEVPVRELTIDGVQLDGRTLPFQHEQGVLSVRFPAIRKASQTLSIRYHGQPKTGVTFGADYLYTGYNSCSWMICLEDPGRKTPFKLEVVLPKDYQLVASGEPLPTQADADGMQRHIWWQARPYPAYVFGFAAGKFQHAKLQQGRTELLLYGVVDAPADLQAKFHDTKQMLAFFAQKAGVALPHRRYRQVLLPGGEAQELSTLAMIGKDMLDPIVEEPKEDWVIAHELAHQWWGNLITCKSWPHFWLNEGITTFMVAAYKQQRWGEEEYQREVGIARKRHQKAIDAGFDKPLTYAGDYPSLGIKRAVVYSKGMLFMHSLRQTLGEDAFWRGLKIYSRRHLGGTVESRDLQIAMEQAAKRPLADVFAQWVY